MEILIAMSAVEEVRRWSSFLVDKSKSKQSAELLLSAVSLIWSFVGYMRPRAFSVWLLMDSMSSIYLYVTLNQNANWFFLAQSKKCMNSFSYIIKVKYIACQLYFRFS